jgi:hypothetical protein
LAGTADPELLGVNRAEASLTTLPLVEALDPTDDLEAQP